MAAIWPATRADVGLVSDILGASFADDPLLAHIASGEAFSRAVYRSAFRGVYAGFGHTYLIRDASGASAGCAMLAGPGQVGPPAPVAALAAVGWHAGRHGGARGLVRLARVARFGGRRPEVPHVYIDAIGVLPGAQGKGLGSRLLGHALALADAAGVPVHLENSRERNLSFYARHGFVITARATVSRGGPDIWWMRRDPRG